MIRHVSRTTHAGGTPWGTGREGLPTATRAPRPDEVVDPVEIRRVRYRCAVSHQFTVPLNAAVEVPTTWECHRCDLMADLVDAAGGTEGEAFQVPSRGTTSGKTHFERVLERRTTAELQVLLDEQLELLRARRNESTPDAP